MIYKVQKRVNTPDRLYVTNIFAPRITAAKGSTEAIAPPITGFASNNQ